MARPRSLGQYLVESGFICQLSACQEIQILVSAACGQRDSMSGKLCRGGRAGPGDRGPPRPTARVVVARKHLVPGAKPSSQPKGFCGAAGGSLRRACACPGRGPACQAAGSGLGLAPSPAQARTCGLSGHLGAQDEQKPLPSWRTGEERLQNNNHKQDSKLNVEKTRW